MQAPHHDLDALKQSVAGECVPEHIAVIMDGNGRWAKQKGKARIFGHQNALTAVRETVEGAAEMGVKFLTLYAFSTENWNRPAIEVNALMELLVSAINKEVKTLNQNNIRLEAIGNLESLPKSAQKQLKKAMESTANNTHMKLILALSYSSRWEILNAVNTIVKEVKAGNFNDEPINEEIFHSYLNTKNYPDPELMIRTSGEYRISNFLLWQLAYAELIFIDKYWPDFRKEDIYLAVNNFQQRERRFGKTSDQLKA